MKYKNIHTIKYVSTCVCVRWCVRARWWAPNGAATRFSVGARARARLTMYKLLQQTLVHSLLTLILCTE